MSEANQFGNDDASDLVSPYKTIISPMSISLFIVRICSLLWFPARSLVYFICLLNHYFNPSTHSAQPIVRQINTRTYYVDINEVRAPNVCACTRIPIRFACIVLCCAFVSVNNEFSNTFTPFLSKIKTADEEKQQ